MSEYKPQYDKIVFALLLNIVFVCALWWLNLLVRGLIGILILDAMLFLFLKKNGNKVQWLVWTGAALYCLAAVWLLFFLDSREKGVTLFENWSSCFIERLAKFPIMLAIYPYVLKAFCFGSLCVIFAIFTVVYAAYLLSKIRRAKQKAKAFPWPSFLRWECTVLVLLIVLYGCHTLMPDMNSWVKVNVYSKPLSHDIQNQTEADIALALGEDQKSFPYAIGWDDVLLTTGGQSQEDGSRYLLLYIYPEWYPSSLATTFDDLQCLAGSASQFKYDVAAISAENASLSRILQWFGEAVSPPYGFTEYHYEMEKVILAGVGTSAYDTLALAGESIAAGHPPQGIILFSPIINLGIDTRETIQSGLAFSGLVHLAQPQEVWETDTQFPATLILYGEKDISSAFAQRLSEYLALAGTPVRQECLPSMCFGFPFIPSSTNRQSAGQRNPAGIMLQEYLRTLLEDS